MGDTDALVSRLVAAIPSIRQDISDYYTDDTPVDSDTAFGLILLPEIVLPALDSGVVSADLISSFRFFEELAAEETSEATEVIAITVCERLGDDPLRLQRARRLMGPRTTEISLQVERSLGRKW